MTRPALPTQQTGRGGMGKCLAVDQLWTFSFWLDIKAVSVVKHKCKLLYFTLTSFNMTVDNTEKDTSQLFKCPQCDYEGSKKPYLAQHIQNIHSEEIHHCQQCDFKTKGKWRLKIHVNSVHLKIKHSCSQCEYTASLRSSLRQHVESVHKKIR